MKQQLKVRNYYKCVLAAGVCHGFSMTKELTLRLDPLRPCAYITRMFDTGDREMTYNRLLMEGVFENVKLEVIVAASNSPGGPVGDTGMPLEAFLAGKEIPPAKKEEVLLRLPHIRGVNAPDLLLHGLTGRYLWIYAAAYPTAAEAECLIRGFHLEFPKCSFTEYFPEIYQGNGFFDRYIGIFQSLFLDEERRVDGIPLLLDYEGTPDENVAYLADWVGIDNRDSIFSPDQLRYMIRRIDDFQGRKGTRKALELMVELVTGIRPRIVESFQWDGEGLSAPNRQSCRALYGETSNHFCVILDLSKRPGPLPLPEEKLERLVESFCMVGTRFKVVMLKPCDHADTHCYLDINSVLSTPEIASVDAVTLGSHITVG